MVASAVISCGIWGALSKIIYIKLEKVEFEKNWKKKAKNSIITPFLMKF